MNDTKKLLEVRDLHKAYSKEGVPTKALNGITFDVLNGEYLGIMGASGSGKTTLLNCIATVIKPTSGQILLSGANISSFDGTKLAEYRGNKIGYLFQDFALLDNLTGKENIILPLSIHNIDIVTAEKKLKDIADFLGITDVLSKFPSQMSGGQKQRVAAARSLISDPDIILADEPTGALDTKSARLLMEKLPYPVIIAATKGDPEAMNIVVQHYESYIASLSMRKLRDERGNIYWGIDEDIRDRLRSRLMRAVLSFKV